MRPWTSVWTHRWSPEATGGQDRPEPEPPQRVAALAAPDITVAKSTSVAATTQPLILALRGRVMIPTPSFVGGPGVWADPCLRSRQCDAQGSCRCTEESHPANQDGRGIRLASARPGSEKAFRRLLNQTPGR